MRFARITFWIAGIYGLLALGPQYVMESKIGVDYPPAITHPEYFYGFIGVAVAWQIMFLLIATDPVRFRPAMLVGVIEKISFGIPVAILYWQGRAPSIILGFSFIDWLLGIFFIIAYCKTPGRNP